MRDQRVDGCMEHAKLAVVEGRTLARQKKSLTSPPNDIPALGRQYLPKLNQELFRELDRISSALLSTAPERSSG